MGGLTKNLNAVGSALLVGGAVVCITLVAETQAGIIGSKHDFADATWNSSQEICVVCHTPHLEDNNLTSYSLLWNHEVSSASYTLYTSPSLNANPQQPIGPSKLCLSCHDGTVAIDSFDKKVGNLYMDGPALIGIDLSGTHPISIQWTHNDVRNCITCHNPHGNLFSYDLPFFEGRVECPTCHNPHGDGPLNPGGVAMLRLPNDGSQLCFYCHHK